MSILESNKKIIITKDTISRLVKDIVYLKKNPLSDNGIFYHHDEEDMLKGYALLIGQKDTPYFGGYYFFKFMFPSDYPFSPPLLTFCSNGEDIRFNPNLYKNGKVCLSILNTWVGEQWSSCQSISSILLTLSTILNNKPLLNEPGVPLSHPELNIYNEIILYSNILIALCGMLDKIYLLTEFEIFYEVMKENFLLNYKDLLDIVENKCHKNIDFLKMNLYHIQIKVNYIDLKQKLIDCYKNLTTIS